MRFWNSFENEFLLTVLVGFVLDFTNLLESLPLKDLGRCRTRRLSGDQFQVFSRLSQPFLALQGQPSADPFASEVFVDRDHGEHHVLVDTVSLEKI